jgi:selenocysteine lyase/cysteine desulfurase
MDRRSFLVRTGMAAGAVGLFGPCPARGGDGAPARAGCTEGPEDLSTWEGVRREFDLNPSTIHMSMFYLASHPRCVRDAIDRHRRGLDANPVWYHHSNVVGFDEAVRLAAAAYLGVDAPDIALTGSTTMGLAMLFNGIEVAPGKEILTTIHDHPVTVKSLGYRAKRSGATVRTVALYEEASKAETGAILARLRAEIRPETRVIACTWVHSCTGVKLPIGAMAEAIRTINRSRGAADRIILCVDGVHGLGIEDVTIPELGCDFFVSGTHKWVFGPRGTGLVWASPEFQDLVSPTIPPFERDPEARWGRANTPGGFQAFEHRWAVKEAFELHGRMGKSRVATRIHALNTQLKEAMVRMPHVRLHTPVSVELSAGINCFEVAGLTPAEVVERFTRAGIVASQSPYTPSYARLAPSLLNDESQVEACIRVFKAMG